jgi:hypothetical protein
VLLYITVAFDPTVAFVIPLFGLTNSIVPKLKLLHTVHSSLPPVPTLNQMNPLHTLPANLPKDPTSHLHLSLLSGLFPSGFPIKTFYTFLTAPMHAKCPTNPILLDLICQMTSEDTYKL